MIYIKECHDGRNCVIFKRIDDCFPNNIKYLEKDGIWRNALGWTASKVYYNSLRYAIQTLKQIEGKEIKFKLEKYRR